jgi:hypothetical protein
MIFRWMFTQGRRWRANRWADLSASLQDAMKSKSAVDGATALPGIANFTFEVSNENKKGGPDRPPE